jgi:uncharacterized protein
MESAAPGKINVNANQWAAITGASSGIGYELAKVFAEEGYHLLVVAENAEIYEAADIFRKYGHEVQTVQADLATYEGVEKFYSEIQSLPAPIDCIVMNAGIGMSGAFLKTDLQRELNLLQLNVVSLVHLTKRILPEFVQRGTGKILFTSSVAASTPGPFEAVYAASKAFVQSFSEALAYELKDQNITVTALQPGATETPFFERAGMLDTKVGEKKKDDAAEVARQGFEALKDGKDHVVAGSLMNKIQTILAKFITEPQGAAMQARETIPHSEKAAKEAREHQQ